MIRTLLLTLTLAGCTVQSAERSDSSAQERIQVQQVDEPVYRNLSRGAHRVIDITDPTVRQFGGQSGEPSAPPTDGLDNTPTNPTSPPPAPPDPPTVDHDTTDSDGDGIPDVIDPDFNAGFDTAEPEDTGDTGDTDSE